MDRVIDFLKKSIVFYLATDDNGQPRVRPFGGVCAFENKLYIATDNKKNVFKQMLKNPRVEISAMYDNRWIRIEALAISEDSTGAKKTILNQYEFMRKTYTENDGLFEVFYLKEGTATIYSYSGDPETILF